jgi:hypothetical protein
MEDLLLKQLWTPLVPTSFLTEGYVRPYQEYARPHRKFSMKNSHLNPPPLCMTTNHPKKKKGTTDQERENHSPPEKIIPNPPCSPRLTNQLSSLPKKPTMKQAPEQDLIPPPLQM